MVVLCKTLMRDLEKMANDSNLQLDDDMVEYIIEETQNLLAQTLRDAEKVANENKRKTVGANDIVSVVKQRGLPFNHFTK